MKHYFKYKKHGRRQVVFRCKVCEPVVREGLAYSPSDMARLIERGMPVNSLNTSQVYFDGEENPSFDIGAERQRYVDVADLWEKHMVLRDKARAAARARSINSKKS